MKCELKNTDINLQIQKKYIPKISNYEIISYLFKDYTSQKFNLFQTRVFKSLLRFNNDESPGPIPMCCS